MKGFAFTLGLSTVLDLVVVFLFTHPLMAVLSRFKSFGSSRFSGLGQVDRAGAVRRRPPGRPTVSSSAPAPAARRTGTGQERPMTPRDRPRTTSPVGTDADEQHDAASVDEDAAAPPTTRRWPTPGCRRRAATGRRPPPAAPASAHRLYNGEAGLDVVGRSKLIYKITAVVVLLCLAVDDLPRLQLRHRLRRRQQLPAAGRQRGARPRCSAAAEDAGRRGRPARRSSAATRSCCAPAPSTPTASGRRRRRRRRRGHPAGRGQPRVGQRPVGPDITDQALIALVSSWSRWSSSWRCGSSRRWPSARSSRCCTTS